MKPVHFPESNTVYAKDQPQYRPLPALKDEQGQVVSCWHLSFRERLRLLFTGKLWVCLHTFNQPLTPVFFTTKKKELVRTEPRDSYLWRYMGKMKGHTSGGAGVGEF